ncbi:DUF3055 domain-containing protein [Cytobacillus gottheilii]|uniref:DUF3055 domain-containing protein n=1 Tax=Cytobacillus gottheilii TaxID=859144 RepID=UPI00082B263C|nr:DUF3055 domain-containing protein [Cytobacillus gottheilii]
MDNFSKIYDEHENVTVRFAGFATKLKRYDFAIVYTNLFYKKPLVTCMQTGRSILLDPLDLEDSHSVQKIFKIETTNQTEDLVQFFKDAIPGTHVS